MLTIGLDIGGANTKLAAALSRHAEPHLSLRMVRSKYFPFWLEHRRLPNLLAELVSPFSQYKPSVAATTTAELSDCFRTKREGVLFVLKSLTRVAPEALVLTTGGSLIPAERALTRPLEVAAANWMAAPLALSKVMPDFLFVDCGSTTTDITPVRDGRPDIVDPSDTGRLRNHELVYTGALRTNVAAIVHKVELQRAVIPVASESFATTADVNLVLNLISKDDYSCPTSDNGPATQEGALVRLARVICSDTESLSERDIVAMAKYIHDRQVEMVSQAIRACLSEHQMSSDVTCIVAGAGAAPIATEAARRAGLQKIAKFDQVITEHLSVDASAPRKDILCHAPAISLSLLPYLRPEICG